VQLDPYDIHMRMTGGGNVREIFVERVWALRVHGYRTALLTNNIAEFRDGWKAMVPADELFDIFIDSSALGAVYCKSLLQRLPTRSISRVTSRQG
jgi:hypothetical protein